MPHPFNKLTACLCCLLQLSVSAQASEHGSDTMPPEQEDALLTLIQLMESDIATKTEKLDVDYLPGLVTVLDGDELRARGFQTVADALNTVPGFQMQLSNIGLYSPVIRGVGGALANVSGKVKLMINGVGINSTQSGKGDAIYHIPIQQVEKIEIIRGPGAAVHGEFAYSGVINVTTRQKVTTLYAGAGNHQQRSMGGNYYLELGNDTAINLSASQHRTEGDNPVATQEALIMNNPPYFTQVAHAPVKISKSNEITQVHADLQFKQFKLNAEHLRTKLGSYYGLTDTPRPNYDPDYVHADSKWTILEGQYLFDFPSHNFKSTLKAGWMDYANNFNDTTLFTLNFAPQFNYTYFSTTHYDSTKKYIKSENDWKVSDMYRLFLGVEYSHLRLDNSETITNFHPSELTPLFGETTFNGFPTNLTREISGVVLQNQITLNKDFELTVGARFDHYVDVDDDDNVSPRLAAVYQLSDHHILKAQYAEAFRPPTFTELYSVANFARGNPDVEPETISTREIAYIYKAPKLVVRSSVFYSVMHDFIALKPVGPLHQYDNVADAKRSGIELEWEHQFNQSFKWRGNLSLVDTEDKTTGQALENTINGLANLSFIYQHSNRWSLNSEIKYIGAPHRLSPDQREPVDKYIVTDLTLMGMQLWDSGFNSQLRISNLFDNDYESPSSYASANPADYEQAGRQYYAQLSYQF